MFPLPVPIFTLGPLTFANWTAPALEVTSTWPPLILLRLTGAGYGTHVQIRFGHVMDRDLACIRGKAYIAAEVLRGDGRGGRVYRYGNAGGKGNIKVNAGFIAWLVSGQEARAW